MTVRFDRSPFTHPLNDPIRTDTAEVSTRSGVSIRLAYDGGVGYGEATPLEPWTESQERCRTALDRIHSHLTSGSPESIEMPTDSPAARHGYTLAVLDRSARMAGVPLVTYLGGATSPLQTPVNATISTTTYQQALNLAEAAVAAGYDTLKCKVGNLDPTDAGTLIRALRDQVGPTIELRLDANGAWTIKDAKTVLGVAADNDVSYVEEPIRDPTLARLERLEDDRCDIAVDESLVHTSADRWDELLELADVCVLKPMALGGLDRTISLAERARIVDTKSVVTTTIDGVIARTAAVHVAAALPGTEAAGVATASLLARDSGPDPIEIRQGTARIPNRPGLGTDGPWHGGTSP